MGDAQVHAIEARINATAPGQLVELEWPATRIETGYAAGNQIAPYYDALVGKLLLRLLHEHKRYKNYDKL